MNKNFASPDCSAKIVGANPGSQGSGNVISTSRDEYFLNKCSDKVILGSDWLTQILLISDWLTRPGLLLSCVSQ